MEKQGKEDRIGVAAGPAKGDFIAPPDVLEVDEQSDALPQQEDFWGLQCASAACRSRRNR